MWLFLGHSGCWLSDALSCTSTLAAVVIKALEYPFQLSLVVAAYCVRRVLAHVLLEAWLEHQHRSKAVSGYAVHNRGSSDRNMRRWLRRLWVNTCHDLSRFLWSYRYRGRHWAWTRQDWAQPLRGSAAADRGADVFSTRASSSALARWQTQRNINSTHIKKDRRGGRHPHRQGSLSLYQFLSESCRLGRHCSVASLCLFSAMIGDFALPSSIAVLAINNQQRQRREAMQITSKAQLLEETEYSEEAGLDANHHGSRGATSMLQSSEKSAANAAVPQDSNIGRRFEAVNEARSKVTAAQDAVIAAQISVIAAKSAVADAESAVADANKLVPDDAQANHKGLTQDRSGLTEATSGLDKAAGGLTEASGGLTQQAESARQALQQVQYYLHSEADAIEDKFLNTLDAKELAPADVFKRDQDDNFRANPSAKEGSKAIYFDFKDDVITYDWLVFDADKKCWIPGARGNKKPRRPAPEGDTALRNRGRCFSHDTVERLLGPHASLSFSDLPGRQIPVFRIFKDPMTRKEVVEDELVDCTELVNEVSAILSGDLVYHTDGKAFDKTGKSLTADDIRGILERKPQEHERGATTGTAAVAETGGGAGYPECPSPSSADAEDTNHGAASGVEALPAGVLPAQGRDLVLARAVAYYGYAAGLRPPVGGPEYAHFVATYAGPAALNAHVIGVD
ncbi:unnamed protein product [Amoebophrya sp. A25]|nr:unnamed protein product [Amoebophrya sp. A25]|eukprot:GSA25T00003342001.1